MIGALSRFFGWGPHEWRRLGWRELRAWIRAMAKLREAETGRGVTEPDSWQGYENDGWWTAQREKHRQLRGH